MAFFRSHWVRTDHFEPLRDALDAWGQEEAAEVPGYVGMWHNQDLDDREFRWVAVETTDRSALVDGGVPALRNLIGLLSEHLGSDVRYEDTQEVRYLARTDAPGPSLDLAYRSMWFLARDLDAVDAKVMTWQQDQLDRATFVRTWLVRGIDDPTVHSISAEFTSVDALRSAGVASFEALRRELLPHIDEIIERRNLYGGVDVRADPA